MEPFECRSALHWIHELLAVQPKHDPDVVPVGIIDELPDLGVAPPLPMLSQVVFEPQLASLARELLHVFQRDSAPVHKAPNRAPGFQPGGVEALWKKIFIWRWIQILNDISVDKRIQVLPDQDDSPWGDDRPINSRWFTEALPHLHCIAVNMEEIIGEGLLIAKALLETVMAIRLQCHAGVIH